MGKPRVMLGAESLFPGNGGICRVARMVARVMAEEAAAGRIEAGAVALSDGEPADGFGPVRVTGRGGSRVRFVADMTAACLGGWTHFVYDFVGMARAHCRLPGLRRPMMVYLHGIEIWEGTLPDRVRAARRADALVVNSAYTRDRALRVHGKFPADPVVCWLATEADEPPPPAPPADGPPTVMILARMDEGGGYKGHMDLIPAWRHVVREVPDARLLVVGRGPGFDTVKALAAQQGPAAGSIEMMGFVPDEQVEKLWTRVHALAMPSRKEGFGLVYIEAMRHGVPVIASVHDAATEVNVEGETGFNVDLDNGGQVALAGRIVEVLRNRSAAAEMGRRGRQRWHDHFRYSAFRDRFLTNLRPFLER